MKPQALLILAAASLPGQVFTGLSSSNFGYGPHAAVILGAAVNLPRLDALGWWAPMRKAGVGDGYALWGQACAPVARGFGPGLLMRYTRNSQWDRAAVYPSGCYSGWLAGTVRVTAYAHLPDVSSVYHGYGATVGIAVPLGRFTSRTGITVLRFRSPSIGAFSGVALMSGVSVRFGREGRRR